MASIELIDMLNSLTVEHSRPYILQWLKKENEVTISKQDLVAFLIGEYKDEVVCDVFPMNTCHLFLGRPWQYDRNVLHHGMSNTYPFKLYKRKWTFTSLTRVELHKLKIGRETLERKIYS